MATYVLMAAGREARLLIRAAPSIVTAKEEHPEASGIRAAAVITCARELPIVAVTVCKGVAVWDSFTHVKSPVLRCSRCWAPPASQG